MLDPAGEVRLGSLVSSEKTVKGEKTVKRQLKRQ